MKKQALFMVLSGKARDNEIIILNDLKLNQPKTKEMAAIIKKLEKKVKKDLNKGALIILPAKNEAVIRAAKNLPKISTIGASSLNVIDLLSHKYLVIPKEAIEIIKRTFVK